MVERGALAECRAFAATGFDPSLPSARVLGAPQLMAALRGEMALDQAVGAAVTATRQYAKRQRTWMRNQMGDWMRVAPGAAAIDLIPAR